MKHIFIFTFLLISFQTQAQFRVKGIVYDHKGKPVPEVLVLIQGIEVSIITNDDGEFTYNCPYKDSELNFQALGYISQKINIKGRDFLEVHLKRDNESESIKPMIGFSSGIKYTPYGIKVFNPLPEIIYNRWTDFTEYFEYRTDFAHNKFLDIYIRKEDLFYLFRKASLSIYGEFKNFKKDSFNINEFSIAPEYNYRGYRLSLGYTYQTIDDSEKVNFHHGVYFGLYKYFFQQFGLDFKSKYVGKKTQFDIKLFRNFFKPKISIGVGYEKIADFHEFTGSLAYRFGY